MDILEGFSSDDSLERYNDDSNDRISLANEAVRYIEQNTSVFNLIERHSLSDSPAVSPEECREFCRTIDDNDDSEVTLASLQVKFLYMRKTQGGHIPFNKFLKTSEQQSVDELNEEGSTGSVPAYFNSLFYQTLARPLTYIQFLKLAFCTLYRLYKKASAELSEILEDIPKTGSLGGRCIEEAKYIGTRLSNNIDEFFENCCMCETLGRHFVDVILDGLPFEIESFKGERLTCDYLEHKLGNLENIANQIISLMYEYLEKKYELYLYSKGIYNRLSIIFDS